MSERQVDFLEFERITAGFLAGGNNVRFKAKGSSMQPFILDGDLVEVQPVKTGFLKSGQVILCKLANGRLVVHRIRQVIFEDLIVQGDAVERPDGLVNRNQVIGLVKTVVRGTQEIDLESPLNRWIIRGWMWVAPVRWLIFKLIQFLRNIKQFVS